MNIRRLIRRGLSLAAAACVAATALAAPSAGAAPVPPNLAAATQCPYTAHDLRNIPVVEREAGITVKCAAVFHDNMETWEKWERPWFVHHTAPEFQWDEWVRQRPAERRLVMAFNLAPKEAINRTDKPWRTEITSGAYDEHLRRLAQDLVAHGLGNSVIRLGSEANGTWRPDSVGDTPELRRQWARAWAHEVRVMKSVPGAAFTFDWNVNAGFRPFDFAEYYPGDDVVDVIGIDQYDSLTVPLVGDRWSSIAAQRGGMNALLAFAKAHNKPVSVPEAGAVAAWDKGAGDDPAYVTGLATALKDAPLAYLGYFNKNTGGVLRLEQVPNTAAAWRSTWGNGTALQDVRGLRWGSAVPVAASGPFHLRVSATSADAVTLTWDSTEYAYAWEYGRDGTNKWGQVDWKAGVPGSQHHGDKMTGLFANTPYRVYVKNKSTGRAQFLTIVLDGRGGVTVTALS